MLVPGDFERSMPLAARLVIAFGGLLAAAVACLGISASDARAQSRVTWTSNGPVYSAPRQRVRRIRQRLRNQAQRRQTRAVRTGETPTKKQAKVVLLPARSEQEDSAIQLVVSLGKQKLTVYRDGQPVGTSRISSGRSGYETPQGIFSIIQKRRHHYSNIYRGAPMPFMQRLTWSGIALHQGVVPGYRASHGCIRLPSSFARSLFGFTEQRTHVIVTGGDPSPQLISHPTLFQPTPVDARSATGAANTMPVRYALNTARDDAATTSSDAESSGEIVRNVAAAETQVSTGDPILDADVIEMQLHRQMMRASKSQSPLRILITRRSQREKVRHAQRLLLGFGYDPGPTDGLIGKQSVIAIRQFQEDEGIQTTGYPNPEFYQSLYRKAGITIEDPAYIYVRQDAEDIYNARIGLKNPRQPLGAHLLTVTEFDAANGLAAWSSTTVQPGDGFFRHIPGLSKDEREGLSAPSNAGPVLDRLIIPDHVRQKIQDLLTPGSSLIIADGGHSRETGQDTDFIVLTR